MILEPMDHADTHGFLLGNGGTGVMKEKNIKPQLDMFKLKTIKVSLTEFNKLKNEEISDVHEDIGSENICFQDRRSFRGDLKSITNVELQKFIKAISRTSSYHPIPFAGNIAPYVIIVLNDNHFSAYNVSGEKVSLPKSEALSHLRNEIIRKDICGSGGTYLFVSLIMNALTEKYVDQDLLLKMVDVGCLLQSMSLLASWKGLRGCIHFFQKDPKIIEFPNELVLPISLYRVGTVQVKS